MLMVHFNHVSKVLFLEMNGAANPPTDLSVGSGLSASDKLTSVLSNHTKQNITQMCMIKHCSIAITQNKTQMCMTMRCSIAITQNKTQMCMIMRCSTAIAQNKTQMCMIMRCSIANTQNKTTQMCMIMCCSLNNKTAYKSLVYLKSVTYNLQSYENRESRAGRSGGESRAMRLCGRGKERGLEGKTSVPCGRFL